MNINGFRWDKTYKIIFFTNLLISIFIVNKNIEICFKDIIQISAFIGFMFVLPFLLIVCGSRIYITNQSILIKVLFIRYNIPFLDIDYFINNDRGFVTLLSLSSERVTLYLKNNQKIRIAPSDIKGIRSALKERHIQEKQINKNINQV